MPAGEFWPHWGINAPSCPGVAPLTVGENVSPLIVGTNGYGYGWKRWYPPPVYAQPARQGWECPRCRRCYSPDTSMCGTCPASTSLSPAVQKIEITSYDNGITEMISTIDPASTNTSAG